MLAAERRKLGERGRTCRKMEDDEGKFLGKIRLTNREREAYDTHIILKNGDGDRIPRRPTERPGPCAESLVGKDGTAQHS